MQSRWIALLIVLLVVGSSPAEVFVRLQVVEPKDSGVHFELLRVELPMLRAATRVRSCEKGEVAFTTRKAEGAFPLVVTFEVPPGLSDAIVVE